MASFCLDTVRDWLSYDEKDGQFRWIQRKASRTVVGGVAGTIHKASGYRMLSIGGKRVWAHRLAWFYLHGKWPNEIDHINGDKADNRASNLRNVDRQTNSENMRRAFAHSSSGLLGAHKHGDRWRARIKVHGKLKSLGVYRTACEAHEAYVMAKRVLHAGNTL